VAKTIKKSRYVRSSGIKKTVSIRIAQCVFHRDKSESNRISIEHGQLKTASGGFFCFFSTSIIKRGQGQYNYS
jgi:hypothetical protein